jgi:hypothetical protein
MHWPNISWEVKIYLVTFLLLFGPFTWWYALILVGWVGGVLWWNARRDLEDLEK